MRNRAFHCRLIAASAGFALVCLLAAGVTAAGQTPQNSAAKVSPAPNGSQKDAKLEAWRERWRQRWIAEHSKGQPKTSPDAAQDEKTDDKADRKANEGKAAWRKRWLARHPKAQARPAPAAPAASKIAAPKNAPAIAPKTPPSAAVTSPATPPAPAASAPDKPVTPTPNTNAAAAKVPAAPGANTPAPAAGTPAPANPLGEARPDVPTTPPSKTADKPLDSPLSAVGDGGKMLLYLAPVVLLIVGALRLLRNLQQKNGRLPGPLQSAGRDITPTRPKSGGLLHGLISNLNLQKARENRGNSIRIIESVPLGGANLHIIEVHGKKMLLGATQGGMNMLTEFDEKDSLENNAFRTLLEEAATNLDGLELSGEELPAPLLVETLDAQMRDASSAVVRSARRLRTVQEAEATWMQE